MPNAFFNQYFTPTFIVKKCLAFMPSSCKTSTTFYIEPAAGGGAFYDLLPADRRIGIEIDDAVGGSRPYMIRSAESHGFLNVTLPELQSFHPDAGRVEQNVVVGNPPFSQPRQRGAKLEQGRCKNMALQFINHAASLAAYCCVLVGANFLRGNVLKKVTPRYAILAVHNLGPVEFDCGKNKLQKLNCCFAVFGPPALHMQSCVPNCPAHKTYTYRRGAYAADGDFIIVKPTDCRANVMVKRWGCVGAVETDATKIRKSVKLEREKEQRRQADKRYGSKWTTGRTCATNFYLFAKDPAHVAKVFADRQSCLKQRVAGKTCGNNPSITVHDLIQTYLQL